MHTIEAVIMDLDGVAIAGNRVVPDVAETIQELHEAGVAVAPATSRDFHRSSWLIEPIGFKSLGVFNGGAAIADFTKGKNIWERRLGRPVVRDLVEKLRPYANYINFGMGHTPTSEVNLDDITSDCLGLWAEIPMTFLPEAEIVLDSAHGIQYHSNHGTVAPGVAGLHITHETADKFSATRLMLGMLEIEPEKTLAIADGDNDLPLFEAVGRRIAMGNASDKLKLQADHIVSDVNNGGFREAIYKYVLGPMKGKA